MRNFFKVSCVLMAIVSFFALIVTFYVGTTGNSPLDSTFGLWIVVALLVFVAALTILCLCLSSVGGKFGYKLGFYILHAGIVILLVGFVISNLTSVSYMFSVDIGSTYEVQRGKIDFSTAMELDKLELLKYDDGSIKQYIGTLKFYDKSNNEIVRVEEISVNHPVRVDGYKLYLMNYDEATDQATFLVKYDMAEYIILIGIVTLVGGTFLMCFSGFAGKKREGKK